MDPKYAVLNISSKKLKDLVYRIDFWANELNKCPAELVEKIIKEIVIQCVEYDS